MSSSPGPPRRFFTGRTTRRSPVTNRSFGWAVGGKKRPEQVREAANGTNSIGRAGTNHPPQGKRATRSRSGPRLRHTGLQHIAGAVQPGQPLLCPRLAPLPEDAGTQPTQVANFPSDARRSPAVNPPGFISVGIGGSENKQQDDQDDDQGAQSDVHDRPFFRADGAYPPLVGWQTDRQPIDGLAMRPTGIIQESE